LLNELSRKQRDADYFKSVASRNGKADKESEILESLRKQLSEMENRCSEEIKE